MDGRKTLALQAVRELLDPDRDDWDELVVANRALVKAIATGRPMTRRNARLVAEYLREAGWGEGAIDAATAPAGARADLRETGKIGNFVGLFLRGRNGNEPWLTP